MNNEITDELSESTEALIHNLTDAVDYVEEDPDTTLECLNDIIQTLSHLLPEAGLYAVQFSDCCNDNVSVYTSKDEAEKYIQESLDEMLEDYDDDENINVVKGKIITYMTADDISGDVRWTRWY